MTCRLEDGLLYVQNYNAENRLSAIHKMDGTDCDSQGEIVKSWLFVYDGDGTRVKTVVMENGNIAETTYYFGGVEMRVAGEATTTKTYYSLAGQLVGMRTVTGTESTLNYFLTDHPSASLRTSLGSVSAILGSTGALVREQRYKPYGEVRGDLGVPVITQTEVGYTGQRAVSGTGLMDYRARFYDPLLYRFVQPDTIVPSAGDPQSWNRYSYVENSPTGFSDPTGHYRCDGYTCKIREKKAREIEEETGDTTTPHDMSDVENVEVGIPSVPFVDPKVSPYYYRGMTPRQLLAYWQGQAGHGTGCGPFSMAMAANLFNNGETNYDGAFVEDYLQKGGYKFVADSILVRMFTNGSDPQPFGMPTNSALLEGQIFTPNGYWELSHNNSITDITQSLLDGKLPIVALTWDTNDEILAAAKSGTMSELSVGHYVLAVGFDENNIYFLDPGARSAELTSYSYSELDYYWNQQYNAFISPGTLLTITPIQ